MDDHDDGHDEGEDVHEVVGGLEDERVGQHERARVALGLDAAVTADFLVANQGTQRYRHLLAYRGEVAETHSGVGRWGGEAVGGSCGRLGAENRRRVGRRWVGRAESWWSSRKASEESARG